MLQQPAPPKSSTQHPKQPPIFILSAGPMSGGHALQKALCSSNDVLIWSTTTGSLNHLLEAARQTEFATDPTMSGIIQGKKRSGEADIQIKRGDNIIPYLHSLRIPSSHIRKSFRQLLGTLYGSPAKSIGFPRWGLVLNQGNQFTVDMLRMTFPRAKFVFLIRHPLDSLGLLKYSKSLPRDSWGNAITKHHPLDSFAQNWSNLASDFDRIRHLGIAIRFEDIQNNENSMLELASTLNISTDGLLRTLPISNQSVRPPRQNLTTVELNRLKPILQESMSRWGY